MKEFYSKIYCNQTDREGLVHARKFFPVTGCKESHYYSFPFGQAVACTSSKAISTSPK